MNADRIEALEAQLAEEIRISNLRADAIENWTNTSAGQHQEIEELRVQLAEAQAMVAAAYEAAAQCASELGYTGISSTLRALTPADAIAARDADRARVRREALEEAAALTRKHIFYDSAGTGFEVDDFEDAIRAMIEEGGNG